MLAFIKNLLPQSKAMDIEARMKNPMGMMIEPGYNFGAIHADVHFASSRDTPDFVGDTAIIPIHGFLAHRFAYHIDGFATGYDYITSMVAKAEASPNIKNIVFDVNSGGGEVAGAFEAAEFIARSTKRTVAVVDSSAYSAAYLLACACDEITLSATASVGSVGVVVQHYEVSKALESDGVKVTYIYAGARKVDGNPYQPLTDEAHANISAHIQEMYQMFVEYVSNHRGISVDDVRGTEAGIFLGNEAVRLGLADTIISHPQEQTEAPMEINQKERIQAILTAPEAANKSLADHLAFNTDMSADEAIKIMKASGVPVAHEAPVGNQEAAFAAAMGAENPEVGASSDEQPTPKTTTLQTFK